LQKPEGIPTKSQKGKKNKKRNENKEIKGVRHTKYMQWGNLHTIQWGKLHTIQWGKLHTIQYFIPMKDIQILSFHPTMHQNYESILVLNVQVHHHPRC